MSGTAAGGASGWRREILLRMRRQVLLKGLGICAFMWVFFVAYFYVLRHPAAPVTLMPLTVVDHAIPFAPGALPVYVSLWLYVGIAPGLLPTLRQAVIYAVWTAALCATGLVLFYAFPTAVPAPVPTIDAAAHAGFALLQGVDAPGNACPSLHVATAVFTAAWIDRLLKDCGAPLPMRGVNGVWMLAIVWSTLATRQHVALDAVAGALLGAGFAAASLRWHGSRHREPLDVAALQAPDRRVAGGPKLSSSPGAPQVEAVSKTIAGEGESS